MVMDATSAAETRERITKWIEETRQIFGLLPELLSADHQAGERVSAAQKEAERLHKDVEELRRENQHRRLVLLLRTRIGIEDRDPQRRVVAPQTRHRRPIRPEALQL